MDKKVIKICTKCDRREVVMMKSGVVNGACSFCGSWFVKVKDAQKGAKIGPIVAMIVAALAAAVNAGAAQIDMAAIAMIESSNNPTAHRKADDSRGLYQITPICLREWNNLGPGPRYTMDDLWNPEINTRIADWYLNDRIPAMLRHYGKPITTDNVLIAYNAGIKYVINQKPLPPVTRAYLVKYRRYSKGN